MQQHLRILRFASLYRSSPISTVPQPPFLNTALLAETQLDPWQLLGLAKALELAAGRRRAARFGPRLLDVDLLLFGDLRIEGPELRLPHPRLLERRFFLAPLAEIAPDLPIPPGGLTVSEALSALGNDQVLERIPWSRQPSD